MPRHEPDSRERAIRVHCAAGNYGLALEEVWKAYRTEMFRFLVGVLHDEDAAHEVFGAFSEEVWKGLPGFRWESSFRTWGYRLLKASWSHYLRSPKRREQAVSASLMPEQAAPNRSVTNPWVRTDVKQEFIALRQQLDPTDQVILMLRIDRKMEWMEIARIMEEGDEPASEAALQRKSAALRQRFQGIKERLREMARAAAP
jgi:RNA polymerase sigma-70 factor, ECF subfamily